jgi:hypothetical protein
VLQVVVEGVKKLVRLAQKDPFFFPVLHALQPQRQNAINGNPAPKNEKGGHAQMRPLSFPGIDTLHHMPIVNVGMNSCYVVKNIAMYDLNQNFPSLLGEFRDGSRSFDDSRGNVSISH